MVDTTASADVLYPYGGTQVNNLVNIIRSDNDNDIGTLKFSPYMYLNAVKSHSTTKQQKQLYSFKLNVQSLNPNCFLKYTILIITDLSKDNLIFDVICFQEMMKLVHST